MSDLTLNIIREKISDMLGGMEQDEKDLQKFETFMAERASHSSANQQDAEIMRAAHSSIKEAIVALKTTKKWIDFMDEFGLTAD